MAEYIGPAIGPTDPDDLIQAAIDYLTAAIPGFVASEGNPGTFLIRALGNMVATATDVGVSVPLSIFRYFGQSVVGLQPIGDVVAATATTWTMVDDAGYTIPAGTNCGFKIAGDTIIPFITTDDVIVPPGSAATPAGAVSIVALDAGVAANNLGPDGFVLLDALSYVVGVAAVTATGGGIDAETDDQYVARLIDEIRLFTPTPILGSDFATMARNIAGVFRSAGVDNYNPADGTTDNERMVAVACIDEFGQPISADIKAAVVAYLESLREANFICNVFDPTYTTVDVAFAFTPAIGAIGADVKALAEQTVADYLNPATWGIEDGDTTGLTWDNQTVVRYNEVISLLNGVDGLRWVNALTLNAVAGDLVLAGEIALPDVGAIVGTPE